MAPRTKTKRKKQVKPRFFIFLAILIAAIVIAVMAISNATKVDTSALLTVQDVSTAEDLDDFEETEQPVSTPRPALPDNVTVVRSSSADPSAFGFSTTLMVARQETDTFRRSTGVSFGRDTEYTSVAGVLTFGGNNYRNSFSYGTVTVSDKRLTRVWEASTGAIDTWSGTGWTGQPIIVQWPDEVRATLGVSETYKNKEGFTEVIYPCMDGYIYFFDLETGSRTRSPINIGSVLKGTGCLDPNGYPLLYVGDAISTTGDSGLSCGYLHVINLITNEEIYRFGKHDYFSYRDWQAYDGSPLIVDDTIFYAGENGVLYSAKLNTVFDSAAGTVSIDPDALVKYRYVGSGYNKNNQSGARWYGIESSIAAFREYLYFTDNGGRLQCVNANTYKLEFVQDVGYEADASVVIEESYDDGTIYLYTASQAYVADADAENNLGYSIHRKINGLTGEIVWEQKWKASCGNANYSGGTIATPAVGHGNLDGMVFYAMNLAVVGSEQAQDDGTDSADATASGSVTLGGRIVAYNTKTGEIMWSVEQQGDADYWASPVLVYDENAKGYLIQCDRDGYIKLYDALNGTLLFSLDAGSQIDSTPAVFNNMLVVGTRGKGGSGEKSKIICARIS